MNIWTKGLNWTCLLMAMIAIAAPSKASDGLEVAVQNDINYLTGGIGVEERREMKTMARDYNVHIWNINKIHKLTMPATLAILDDTGNERIKIYNADPVIFAELPMGSYTVKATYDDQEQEQKVVIKKKSDKYLTFVWDDGAQKVKHRARKKHSVKLKTKKETVSETKPAKDEKAKEEKAKEEKLKEEKAKEEKAKEEKLKEEKAEEEKAKEEKLKEEKAKEEKLKEEKAKEEKAKEEKLKEEKAEEEKAKEEKLKEEKAKEKKAKEEKIKEEKAKKEKAKEENSSDQPYFETPEKKD